MESDKQSARAAWTAPRDNFFGRQPFPGAEYGPYRDADGDADSDSSTNSCDRVMTPNSSASESLYMTPRLNRVRQMTDNSEAPFDMEFLFGPRQSHEVVPGAEWEAALQVRTPDVAALMLNGFHWDESNTQGRPGGISFQEIEWETTPADPASWGFGGSGAKGGEYHLNGWPLARHYNLQSKGRLRNPKWTAVLRVRAREQSTLCRFRIGNLSPANCYSAKAWAKRAKRFDSYRCVLYHYDSERPQDNCNTFFDDMPLEGWWPWPKAAGKAESKIDGSKKDSRSPEQEDGEDRLCRVSRQQGVRVVRVGSPSAFNNNGRDVGRRHVTVHGVDVRSYMVLAIFVILIGSAIVSVVHQFGAINSRLRSTAEPQSTVEQSTPEKDTIELWSTIESQDPIAANIINEPADEDLPINVDHVLRMRESPHFRIVLTPPPPPSVPKPPAVPAWLWTWILERGHERQEL